MEIINKGKCFKTKILFKVIILTVCFINVFVILGCNNSYQRKNITRDFIPKKEEIVVPIKLPELPYELKFGIKSISWNENYNSLISSQKGRVIKMSTEETTKRKIVGHSVTGSEYEEGLWDKFSVIAADNYSDSEEIDGAGIINSSNEIINGNDDSLRRLKKNKEEQLKSLYGICEIVKFNNQIYKTEKNRCSGRLYYQIKITNKGKTYVKPKFKIKNAEGLVMEVFMERYPDLSNLNENEITEGYIVVSDQEYSDTYELIIE